MNGDDLLELGYKSGKAIGLALAAAEKAQSDGLSEDSILSALLVVLKAPDNYIDDLLYGLVARELAQLKVVPPSYDLDNSAPLQIWGKEGIESGALEQIQRAIRLPVAVRGALMPDAHQGYGLPIGGVLATYNSVIPYAVGVDIACRMRMTIFDSSPFVLDQKRDKFRRALENNTRFGAGKTWDTLAEHAVMDDPLWSVHWLARKFKDTAWRQLGTSGSGNHFVEFGALTVEKEIELPDGKIAPGKYLALLSHSGSRRFGMEVANHYTEVAMQQRTGLPKDFIHLSWLDLDYEAGIEYWEAMNLAGRYASANHAVIHQKVADAVHFPILGVIENHHNFAWAELLDGEEVIVHRKGATPAGEGVLGVIPGSMSAPGYVVRGLGNVASLSSAAHGAGRRMSRSEAFKRFDWEVVSKKLKASGVELLSGGLDESPGAYKDIRDVMASQVDLVESLAEFQPKLVKMDAGGKRPDHFRED